MRAEGLRLAKIVSFAGHYPLDHLQIDQIFPNLDAPRTDRRMAPHISSSITSASGEATMIEPSIPTERLIMSAPACAAKCDRVALLVASLGIGDLGIGHPGRDGRRKLEVAQELRRRSVRHRRFATAAAHGARPQVGDEGHEGVDAGVAKA